MNAPLSDTKTDDMSEIQVLQAEISSSLCGARSRSQRKREREDKSKKREKRSWDKECERLSQKERERKSKPVSLPQQLFTFRIPPNRHLSNSIHSSYSR